jgi:ribosomal-protein-alanine N-acetyltransferase
MSTVLQRLSIEPMREEHIADIHAIEVQAYVCPWSEASFRAELTNHMSHYIVLKRGPVLVGYAGEWLVIDEAHITTVAVEPQHRGKKYGELLVGNLLTYAANEGMERATLEVRESNVVAQRLYEKYGFETVAVRKCYYPDRENACVMWLNELGRPEYLAELARQHQECMSIARSSD